MRILSVDRRTRRRARELLAVRAGLSAWCTVGLLFLTYPLLPGADHAHTAVLLAAGAAALAWALTVSLLPASRRLIPLFQTGTVASMALIPVGIAATGGSTSPLRVLPLLIIVYCTWFYDARTSAWTLGAVSVLHLLPLAYDTQAFRAPGLAVTIVLAITFAMTAALMMGARRELVAMRDSARAEALHDPLTDLANRRALMAYLEKRSNGRRGDDRTGLVLVDLDGFKQVNTIHGHHGGDVALSAAADALRSAARESDLVARLGGDEFAIVLPDAAPDADTLLATADAALATAKREGKARVVTSGILALA